MADTTATVRTVIAVVDQATAPLRGIQAQFKGFGAGLQGAAAKFKSIGDTTGLSKLGSSLGGIAQKAGGVAKSIAGIGLSLVGIGGLAGGLGLRSVVGWMNDMVAAGGALHDTAPKIGVTVEQLQELRHWASMGGVEAGTMEGAIKKLNKNLGDMATGKGKGAAAILESFGVKAGDPRLKSAALLMPAIADGLQKIKDPALQAQAAVALFGRSGVEMLPALLEGSKAIRSAAEEARKLGIISTEDAARADEFGEAQEKLGKTIRGVQYAIGAKLLPVLLPVIDAMKEWVAVNREWLAGKVEKAIWAVVGALQTIDWAAWGARLQSVMGLLAGFIDLLGGVDKAVMLLAAIKFSGTFVTFGKVLLALMPILTMVGTALAGFAATLGAPLLIALAALAAAAYLIYQNWDKIAPVVTRAWDAITGGVATAWTTIQDFAGKVGTTIAAGFATVGDTLASIGTSIAGVLGPVLTQVVDWGKRLWSAFSAVFTEVAGLLSAVGQRLGQELADALGPVIERVLTWGKDLLGAFTDVWTWVKGSVTGAFDAIAPALTAALDPIRATAERAWNGIRDVFKTGTEAVEAWLGPLAAALSGIMGTLERAVGFVERGLRGIAGLVAGARESMEDAVAAETEADAVAGRVADKAELKRQRTAERATETAAPPITAPARGPGPWLPELATAPGSAANGTVNVVIENKNAPPGTRVTSKTSGTGIKTQTGVGYSMPQLQPAGAG
jgi:phage-related protein